MVLCWRETARRAVIPQKSSCTTKAEQLMHGMADCGAARDAPEENLDRGKCRQE